MGLKTPNRNRDRGLLSNRALQAFRERWTNLADVMPSSCFNVGAIGSGFKQKPRLFEAIVQMPRQVSLMHCKYDWSRTQGPRMILAGWYLMLSWKAPSEAVG